MVHPWAARLIILILFLVLGIATWQVSLDSKESAQFFSVSFLDVGQGDAIYIQTPDGFEMLVDGGRDSLVLNALSSQRSFFDRKIDLVVATHPDLDHIGGLIDVFRRYEVETILLTENKNDTPAAAAFSEAIASENAALIYANAGQRFQLGASTTVTIYSPVGDETNWETNNASIILKVTYGDIDVLLTGDAPFQIEEYIVDSFGAHLQAEVLKLGHHGSRTSTSELFLDTVKPEYAIVSAAIDSPYNHPHQEVMQRVFARDIPTFHTGVDGTITFLSDGEEVWVE